MIAALISVTGWEVASPVDVGGAEAGGGVEAAGYGLGDQCCAALCEEVDEVAFLGDEGVDAGGFGVEVVSNRPLCTDFRDQDRNETKVIPRDVELRWWHELGNASQLSEVGSRTEQVVEELWYDPSYWAADKVRWADDSFVPASTEPALPGSEFVEDYVSWMHDEILGQIGTEAIEVVLARCAWDHSLV
ncbi:MAG: hypothetical protein OXB92_16070 [Acidimicrobiaceae bacterium]|nr:hypothetical protein [Acidimicrobiia bacterium]MCY4495362.1 hypothetical protein [Acidimicrobiaceae bacterium]